MAMFWGLLLTVCVGLCEANPPSDSKSGKADSPRRAEAPSTVPATDTRESEANKVNSGFVFDRGRYVPPPYVVTRKGFDIFINDIRVVDPNMAWLASEAERLGLVDDPEVQQQCKNVRKEYEEYFEEGYAYLVFPQGQQVRLNPQVAPYTLAEIVGILRSDLPRQAKVDAMGTMGWQFGAAVENLSVLAEEFSAPFELEERVAAAAEARLWVSAFGREEAEPIESGFVFLGGEYLDAPYKVMQRGLGIFVNGRLVRPPWFPWPPPEVPQENPAIPPEITKWSSMWDKAVADFSRRKGLYLSTHLSRAEERDEWERTLRALPYVKEARLDPDTPDILHSTTFRGEESATMLMPPRRRPLSDKLAIERNLQGARKGYEDDLRSGVCCLTSYRGGESTISAANVPHVLPEMVAILCSPRAAADKLEALQTGPLKDVAPGTVAELVANFKCSEQLKQRVSLLKSTE